MEVSDAKPPLYLQASCVTALKISRRVTLQDPAGRTTTYGYDAANELTGVTYSSHTPAPVTFAYDADGQRTGMTDVTGQTRYAYDSLHRLTASTNGAGSTIGYGYDLVGQLTSLAYPATAASAGTGSRLVTRGYDAAGRMTSVRDWFGNVTTATYDADSDLTGETYPNGVVASPTYDNADRVTGISDSGSAAGQFLNLVDTRDGVGLLAAEGGASYGYNNRNRLTSSSFGSFAYDTAGDPTQLATSKLSYDRAHEVTGLTGSSGTVAFTYDSQGNRTADANGTYVYNQANELIAVSGPLPKAVYSYDGDGLRATKAASSVSTYAWDVAEGVPLLMQDSGTSYVSGPGGAPLEEITASGTTYWYHQDQLGSTRALTDSGGHVAGSYSYTPYGGLAGSAGVTTPLLYAGQY